MTFISFRHKIKNIFKTKEMNSTDPDFTTGVQFYNGLVNENLTFRSCVLWGLDHFRTFTGTQFEFAGE